MKKIRNIYHKYRKSGSVFIIVMARFIIYKLIYKKEILAHQRVSIRGVKNIDTKSKLEIGVNYVGFMHKSDKTYLNIDGKLALKGNCSIGRGCRFDIGRDAVVTIGGNAFINVNTNFIISHNLTIGDDCVISWNCQFLDDDFHEIGYEGKKNTADSIVIGQHVWIGCGVSIYKGTVIPDGCVIASNSVIRGKFHVKNAIIGGNPARVIRENIVWE
ncbi:MAG TPA: acyltransferase [Puia sp.]|nr:acyltransferase [Puia sp.]